MSIEKIELNNKTKLKNKEYYALIIVMTLMERCFYLINVASISVSGVFNYDDIALGIFIFFCGYITLKYKNFRMKKYRFKWIVLYALVLVFLSSYISFLNYNQNIVLGIRSQRFFLTSYLMYFVIAKYMSISNENRERFKKAVYTLAWIEITVYIGQYILKDVYMFTYVVRSVRYGGARLHFDSCILQLAYFMALSDFLNVKKAKRSILLIVIILIFNMFVIRGRLVFISLVCSSIISILLWKKNILLKLSIILSASIVFIVLLMTPMMSNYLSVFDSNVRAADGSYQLREEGKAYYKYKLKECPIFGKGFINILNEKATVESGRNRGYSLNDNGMMGFIFMYGYAGAVWVGIMFSVMFFYSWISYRKYKNYASIAYISFLTIILSNIINFYWEWTPAFFIFMMAFLESNLVIKKSS